MKIQFRDAEVSKVFEYGEGLSQSGGMLKARKRPAKGGVDREWPIFKWHSQLAFGEAQSILRWLALDRVGATHSGCTDSP